MFSKRNKERERAWEWKEGRKVIPPVPCLWANSRRLAIDVVGLIDQNFSHLRRAFLLGPKGKIFSFLFTARKGTDPRTREAECNKHYVSS